MYPKIFKCIEKSPIYLKIPYARHYKPRLVYFFTPFSKIIYVLWPLVLCMACIQERLLIKSGLWWRAYGIQVYTCIVDHQWHLGKSKPFLCNLYLFKTQKRNRFAQKATDFPRHHWRFTLYLSKHFWMFLKVSKHIWIFFKNPYPPGHQIGFIFWEGI